MLKPPFRSPNSGSRTGAERSDVGGNAGDAPAFDVTIIEGMDQLVSSGNMYAPGRPIGLQVTTQLLEPRDPGLELPESLLMDAGIHMVLGVAQRALGLAPEDLHRVSSRWPTSVGASSA